jgi:hypothetical protein
MGPPVRIVNPSFGMLLPLCESKHHNKTLEGIPWTSTRSLLASSQYC